MGSTYSQVIMEKAESFSNYLNQNNITVKIDKYSLREYSVKLKSTEFGGGSLILDYSSKNNAFSIRPENIKGIIFQSVLKHWENMNLQSINEETNCNPFIANQYKLYTDGTSDGYENIAYAFIVLKGNEIIYEQASRFYAESEEERNSHQVISEIKAVEYGLEWCSNNGIKELLLYYDFENLQKWVCGEYKAEKHFTRSYVSFVRNCGIKISWHKVKSHSGDLLNEKTDKLAAKALNDENSKEKRTEDFYLFCKKFKDELFSLGYINTSLKNNPSSTPSCTLSLDPIGKIHLYLRNNGEITESLHDISTNEKDNVKRIINNYKNRSNLSQLIPQANAKFKKLTYLYNLLKIYNKCCFDFSALAEEISIFLPAEKDIIMNNAFTFSVLEKYVIKLTSNYQQ